MLDWRRNNKLFTPEDQEGDVHPEEVHLDEEEVLLLVAVEVLEEVLHLAEEVLHLAEEALHLAEVLHQERDQEAQGV